MGILYDHVATSYGSNLPQVGGTAGAELVHTSLPAEHWGLSRLQLLELATSLWRSVVLVDNHGGGGGSWLDLDHQWCFNRF